MTQNTPRPAAVGAKPKGAETTSAETRGAETQSAPPGAGYDWQDPLALEGELTPDYFDQAHFTRDFKQITGATPGRY
jgi:hypothetical protein